MTLSLVLATLLIDYLIYRRLLAKQQRETTQITAELIRLDIEQTGHFKIQGQDGVHYDYTLTDKKTLTPHS